MIENTFCHLPNISLDRESHLWSQGINSWYDLLNQMSSLRFSKERMKIITNHLEKSIEHLEKEDPAYFAQRLAASQHWRFFPDFQYATAYLDIETSGGQRGHHITTIALYDGRSIFYYVHGENLRDFKFDIQRYQVIITYNGKTFDIPLLERYFKIKLNHVHLDLRYILASLGYKGGLKRCEKRLGLHRQELDGLSGRFAIFLWDDYRRNRNRKALDTLLAYNIADVVNLETLMVIAYNKKLYHTTPFHDLYRLEQPAPPEVPVKADTYTIDRIMRENGLYEANPYL